MSRTISVLASAPGYNQSDYRPDTALKDVLYKDYVRLIAFQTLARSLQANDCTPRHLQLKSGKCAGKL
jgi:hypothetical protein